MRTAPPLAAEIEISVFGPGYGESILVHFGDGVWGVVDSCINIETEEVAALSYLASLGVDPAKQVRFVLATHWHDDHVRGFGQIVERCEAAEVICSLALREDEFLHLVAQSGQDLVTRTSSGVDELRQTLRLLEARGRPPFWAASDRRVTSIGTSIGAFDIWTLSPSNHEVTRALNQMAQLAAVRPQAKKRITSPRRNDATVASWFGTSDFAMLLGGDLEETNNPLTGWSAIVGSTGRPRQKADLYKAPHHGSENGHFPGTWSDLLVERPLTVLAPWTVAGNTLPTRRGVRLLCERSSAVHQASRVPRKVRARSPDLRRATRESVSYLTEADGELGQVRIRCLRAAHGWDVSVEHFDAAFAVC